MREMQTTVTDVRGVCLSVSLSVHQSAAQLGFTVQKWLNRSRLDILRT